MEKQPSKHSVNMNLVLYVSTENLATTMRISGIATGYINLKSAALRIAARSDLVVHTKAV